MLTYEVETGFEPVYTALQAVASPLGHSTMVRLIGLRADDETRTRDPHLGKVMRYQLRYIRMSGRLCARQTRTLADAQRTRQPGYPASHVKARPQDEVPRPGHVRRQLQPAGVRVARASNGAPRNAARGPSAQIGRSGAMVR